jgi:hypothetical protein
MEGELSIMKANYNNHKNCQRKVSKIACENFVKIFCLIFLLQVIFFCPKLYSLSDIAAQFLLVSPGSRANGMAGAFTAISNDIGALHYNPAGISKLKFGAVEYNYSNFDDGLSYHFRGAAYPVSEVGVIAIGSKLLSYGTWQSMNEFGNPVKSPKTHDWSLSFCYSTTISKNFSCGLTFRYLDLDISIYRQVGGRGIGECSGFSFDLGFIYQNLFSNICHSTNYNKNRYENISNIVKNAKHRIPPGFSIGLCIQNMGPKIEYVDAQQRDNLPQNLRLGIAWNFYDTPIMSSLISCDFEKLLIRNNPQEGQVSDPFYKAIFSSWSDRSFKDELKEGIISIGLETFYKVISFRIGRYVDEIGKLKYWSYGLSIGFVKGNGTSSVIHKYTFTDTALHKHSNSIILRYRLKQIDFDGTFIYSKDIEISMTDRPLNFELNQNYPNPFNPQTEICYQLSKSEQVSIVIYNNLGQKVRTLVSSHKPAGYHTVSWNGRNDDGSLVTSGIYIYKLQVNGAVLNSRKMILLK